MIALSLQTTVASDGTIDLHISSDLPPGEAEVVLVVQPGRAAASVRSGPPYPSDHGVWQGKLPDGDIDAELREMNAHWATSMELP